MNFFQPLVHNPNASAEVLVKKRIAWNKGLFGDKNPQTGVSRPRQSELMKKIWADSDTMKKRKKSNGPSKGCPATHTTYVYHTPAGVFDVRGDAMKANNCSMHQLISRCKRASFPDWSTKPKPASCRSKT